MLSLILALSQLALVLVAAAVYRSDRMTVATSTRMLAAAVVALTFPSVIAAWMLLMSIPLSTSRPIAAVVLIAAGVAWLYLQRESDGKWTVERPDLILVVPLAIPAAIFWGLTTLVLRITRLSQASAEKALFYQIAMAAAVTTIASLVANEPWTLNYSSYAWWSLALQSVVGAFVSYLTWMWMLRHYPATRMASFTFLTPVFALIFGVGFLGEHLSWQLLVAIVGVAAGIWLVNQKGRPQTLGTK